MRLKRLGLPERRYVLCEALAVALARQDVDDRDAIRRLGEGWVGEEALAIAVYCALKHSDSFEDAIIASVNHSGDSDSTGAVTGNILGTALGYRAIPDHYLEKLELRDIIEEVAQDLYEDCKMSEYGDYRDPVWESKYIYIGRNKGTVPCSTPADCSKTGTRGRFFVPLRQAAAKAVNRQSGPGNRPLVRS